MITMDLCSCTIRRLKLRCWLYMLIVPTLISVKVFCKFFAIATCQEMQRAQQLGFEYLEQKLGTHD